MFKMKEELFEGYQCQRLNNEHLSIWVTTEFGPRIIGLSLPGAENLMAVLPDAKIPVAGAADFSLRGGHRLWYAPERPETTYLPDDQAVEIKPVKGGIETIQKVDIATGIQKFWEVILDENSAQVTIEHSLLNTGNEPFHLAPWAVTMLRPGGVGVIPLQLDQDDVHGLWPNRQLVFWPYADLNSPYLKMTNEGVGISAKLDEGAIKVGAPNPRGWMAYGIDGTLFVKKSIYYPHKKYLDRQASSQIYSNPSVVELETLGPVADLGPGESITHQEVWQIFSEGKWPTEIESVFDEIGNF